MTKEPKTSIEKQRTARINKLFGNIVEKLLSLELSEEDLEDIRRKAKSLEASAKVRIEFMRQGKER